MDGKYHSGETPTPVEKVEFLHEPGKRYTVTAYGRWSILHGGDFYVELQELPGQFAPSVFKRVIE